MDTPKLRLESQFAFLLEIDKLKEVLRRNYLASNSRRENTAEHSWHLVMFAMTLHEHALPGPDGQKPSLVRILRMCAVHDLVEIYAGDTFLWDEAANLGKEERERQAGEKLFGILPPDQAAEYLALWEEFEAGESPEAIFANAVDRFAPVMLNVQSGGVSWKEAGISRAQVAAKMTGIAKASPELGRVMENLLDSAVAKGLLS